ncbi:membrane protein DedA with SNARE-associated domain [Terracoccus luteus]|uniref:Membrane protein DedA with SNARE-associated domain n=1 Tax=Terracoccus luteus TaxID=53356 RepID=A0A495XWT9_9MICO|nr:DedA family protein [Terracoccus luteus]RKT77196.1 membrane protein DedA with SNARE-associated domain [Terracoccus luteus]
MGEVGDVAGAMLHALQAAMLSPWLYAILVGLAVLDVFFPLVPSETALLLAGTYAATAGPEPVLVVAAGALGAVLGDLGAYGLARALGAGLLDRARPGSHADRAHTWARTATERRGAAVLVGARFVPFGRTAVTMTMGATRYPLRGFVAFDVLASVVWASFHCTAGYVGGVTFSEHPVVGVLCGMTIAVTVGALVEVLGRRRDRAAAAAATPAPEPAPSPPRARP